MKRRAAQVENLFDDSPKQPTISGIAPLPRDPNLRRIKVDGRIVATLRAADVEGLKLQIGGDWTKTLADRVAQSVAAEKARHHALGLLGRRPYSPKELTDRLLRRGHAAAVAQRIVEEAVRDGWLDERAYADDIVRGVIARRPAGRRLLEDKLRRHGVKPAVARQALDNAAPHGAGGEGDETHAAYELARRRFATMEAVKPEAALRRIAGLLVRRGFDEDVVHAAIERLRAIVPPPPDAVA